MFKHIKEQFSKVKKLAIKQPETLRYEELEQRVLFSADVVPGLDTAAVEEQVLVQDVAADVQAKLEAALETVEQTAAETRRELVLVNQNVPDYEQLIADLQGGDNNRIIEVVVLEADRDGIEQVSEILAERSDLSALHFIAHGSDGQINVGNSSLNSTTLQQNSDAVGGWGKALTETGDIFFYGCNIAAASDGQTLLDDIAELTGADVAASDDAMGHELLGGDWDLEYSSGSIESSVALSESVQQNWTADLATATTGDDTLSIGVIGETFDALAGDDSEPIPLAAERTDDHTFTLNHTNIDSTYFNDRITSFVVGDPGGDRQGSQDGIHVIMIDTSLAQYQELVDAAEEGTHVIEYNGETESAEAVLARAVDYAKNNQETIDSISIMSHGLSGEFKLGNEWIGSDDLADHAEAWHALDEVMNDGGNIYLYGCNVAEDSEAGQALLDGLAEVTHADVFASNDVTGAGGDWDLEAASTGDEAELERGLNTNLDADELADYADALADYSGAGWSGAQTFIDGAISFTLEVTGGGTIDWSYDGTTDTLTITDNDGTSAATSVTITDNNGGLNVDSITTDMKLGSLTCNTDIVTLTMGKAISNTIVGSGSGTISSLIITDTLQNETVNIYANISSVISTSQFWGGDFNVTGDVGSIDMTGSPGKLRDSSITVNGDLDSINVQKYEGTVSIVVTNVIGQFDMVGDYVYSNNFTTATYFSFDGSSVITDANEAPTVSLSNLTATLSEDTDTTAAIKVADITLSDDGLGTNNLTLAGADAASFEIVGSELRLKAGTALDFETKASFDVTVQVDDAAIPGTPDDTALHTLNITDVNEVPTVSLTNLVNNLTEDTDTSAAIKIADIVITDDALGTNNLTLAGADAASFEIVGSELRLKAGTALNFETKASFDVTVQVDDAAIPGTPEDTALHTLNITDANEAPSVVDDNASGNEDTVIVGNVLSNDSDVDGDTLTASLVSGPAHGSLTLNVDGNFSYTPDADWNGTDSFTYTTNDGALDSNVATMTITVNPVNDAPTVPSSAVTAATEDAAYSCTITTRDVDGDVPTIMAPTLPAWLTLVDNKDGTATLSGTPTNADVGDHSVELEIDDGALTELQDFTLTVSEATIDPPVDDADPDLRSSTNPDPKLFEDPETDDVQDPGVAVPTSEEPATDPVIEDKQAPPVEEHMMPQGSADADDQLVHIQDPEIEENEEIIYLTDEMDTDIRAEEREDDLSLHYFDNDLYKDLFLSKYLAINYTAADEPIPKSGDDLSILDLDNDDPNQVEINGDYDVVRQEIDDSFNTEMRSQAVKAKIVTISAATFAAGVVSYLIRVGSMVSSLMSSLPLWRGFDPIAIFSGDKKRKKDRNEMQNKNEPKSETLFDGEAE